MQCLRPIFEVLFTFFFSFFWTKKALGYEDGSVPVTSHHNFPLTAIPLRLTIKQHFSGYTVHFYTPTVFSGESVVGIALYFAAVIAEGLLSPAAQEQATQKRNKGYKAAKLKQVHLHDILCKSPNRLIFMSILWH